MTVTEPDMDATSDPIEAPALSIDGLEMSYVVRGTPRKILRGVTFEVRQGEAYGLVGESGCGKSTTAYAALRYLPGNGVIDSGRVLSGGEELTAMSASQLREFRANRASMVFQDPVQAVNPVLKIGTQVAEAFQVMGQSKSEAKASALEAMKRVRIAAPESVMERYPHQLSGGMLQRVVIAMGLACDPNLLVLDEPTTGLDATVEAEVLDLVRELRSELNSAILLIAHNLGVIRSMCDRVGVMYAGRIVEEGTVAEVFDNPSHPYTKGLLNSIPRRGLRKTDRELFAIPGSAPPIGADLPHCTYVDRCPIATDVCRTEVAPIVERSDGHWTRCHHADRIGDVPEPDEVTVKYDVGTEQIIGVEGVSKTFHQRGHDVPALVGVNLSFAEGETLGLVGESGSGKSTLAKTMLGVHSPDEGGAITLRGRKMAGKSTSRIEESVRAISMVFQNPDSALNRAWTVRRILLRSVVKLTGIKGAEADKRVEDIAEAMQLSPRHLDMRPRQLSGGLKQRVAIARAFAGDPEVVVCDEPTSALDVSVQAAILNLLARLQNEERSSYLFISHDIGVVRYLADRVAVMYLGRIMEIGMSESMFSGVNHPYTEALLSAVPSVDGEAENRIPLDGEIPSPANPPPGCVFHTRCHRAIAGLCEITEPEMVEIGEGHSIKCHLTVEQLREPIPVAVSAS
ncbi:MAG: peptide/nickel transport system ATP-binding protein [Candidatus Aldehydirespiratoraceae bacterium]|jgi:peptide/nickel transport system ATP-binding protein